MDPRFRGDDGMLEFAHRFGRRYNEKDEAIARLEDEVRNKTQAANDMQAQLDDEKRRRRGIEQENERLLKDLDQTRREAQLEKDGRQMDRTILARLENENAQLRDQSEKAQKNAFIARPPPANTRVFSSPF